jgi:hypothetical protein
MRAGGSNSGNSYLSGNQTCFSPKFFRTGSENFSENVRVLGRTAATTKFSASGSSCSCEHCVGSKEVAKVMYESRVFEMNTARSTTARSLANRFHILFDIKDN